MQVCELLNGLTYLQLMALPFRCGTGLPLTLLGL